MDNITLERTERINMFFQEYYFGGAKWRSIFRLIGGPVVLFVGLHLYRTASDRFSIAYGGIMIAYAVYYTLKPFWWVLLKYKHFRTIKFQLQATPNELILTEPTSESRTAYSTFELG